MKYYIVKDEKSCWVVNWLSNSSFYCLLTGFFSLLVKTINKMTANSKFSHGKLWETEMQRGCGLGTATEWEGQMWLVIFIMTSLNFTEVS